MSVHRFALIAVVLVACREADEPPAEPKVALYADCYEDAQCESGWCVREFENRFCALECDEGCPAGGKCADGRDGPLCVANCNVGREGTYACVDATPVYCDTLEDDRFCHDCGCPEGQACERGVGCSPLGQPGEACTEDEACVSGHCGTFEGQRLCMLAVGAACECPGGDFPCETAECGRCYGGVDVRNDAPWSMCTRDCTDMAEVCPDEYGCAGESGVSFECLRKCDSAGDCPTGECVLVDTAPLEEPYFICEP